MNDQVNENGTRKKESGDANGLSAKQQKALDALLLGQNVSRAAEFAKVDRRTVYRWLKNCYKFQAAYNLSRSERLDAREQLLSRMSDGAIFAVADKIEKGDAGVGLQVIKGNGLLSGVKQQIESGDAKQLESQDDDDSFLTKRKLLFEMLDSDPNPESRADFFLRIRGNKPPFEWQYDYEQGVITKEELDAPGHYEHQRPNYAELYAQEREKVAARKQAAQSPHSDSNDSTDSGKDQ